MERRNLKKFFSSIRWRLTASYVTLALITATVLGLLALKIVENALERQVEQELQSNAEMIALQVGQLLWPVTRQEDLQQLVQTAAFLGNYRVRILDAGGGVYYDSGSPGEDNQLIWVYPQQGEWLSLLEGIPSTRYQAAPFLWILPSRGRSLSELEESIQRNLPGASVAIIRRRIAPWGSRFSIESSSGNEIAGVGSQQPAPEPEIPEEVSPTVVQEAVYSGGRLLGYVEISGRSDFGAGALDTMRRALIFAGGSAAVLAGVLGLFISQRLSAPLRHLGEAAQRMGSGDLSIRAAVLSQDEIGQLALQFNQMASQIENSFKALSAERDALRRFIADASHELRTPITALKNFNILLQEGAGEDPEVQKEFLTESQTQIERLEWITHNLLDLSRLDAGLVDLDLEACDAEEFLQSTAAPFVMRAQEKGVQMQVIPPEQPITFQCDRRRLEIAVSNLLDNAIKFTDPGGAVEAGAALVNDRLHIWVRDTGPGISPRDLASIFERFYHSSHPAAGSGLGLAIVKSIVEAHSGQIRVESKPGEGSVFSIELPLTSETANKG